MNIEPQVFHSVDELVEYGDGPETGSMGRSSRSGDADWTQTADWSAAKELALKGWDTKRRKLTDQVTAILNEAGEDGFGIVGATFDYNVSGTDVDIDRFLMGEPENMIEWQPTSDKPAIRLVMSSSYSASVKTETIVKRGATVAALVEALGQAGISIEIWMESGAKSFSGKDQADLFVRVKSFTEPLDIDSFVFTAAHPSFLRRLVFAAQERRTTAVRDKIGFKSYGSYGMPCTAVSYDPIGGVDIAVPSMIGGYGDQILTDPIGWIKDTIKSLNLAGSN